MSVGNREDGEADHGLVAVPAGRSPFVGRAVELAELQHALDASRSRLQLRFVVGEAGIGKTRLATELSILARARGHRVVWGYGWDDSTTPPYWPWIQVTRALRARHQGTDLAALVLDDDAPVDRFDLFDAASGVLRDTATRTPLLVVLDDLHLADPPTLALVRFVVTHLRDIPLLLVATFREHEAAARPELTAHLGALDRHAVTLRLDGLTAEAVGMLVGDDAHVEDLLTATGGNPLFLEQAMDADIDGDTTLLSVLATRVRSLGPDVATTLAAAAVLGHSPDLDDLATVVDLPPDTIDSHLTVAARARLFDRHSVRFAHPLVADAALVATDPVIVAALHASAADRLTDGGTHPADRANHLLAAGPHRWRDAVAACREAAEVARVAFAHEDAVAHLERAAVATRVHEAEPALAAEVRLELGWATVQAEGRTAAEPHYHEAWRLAALTDDATLQARVAARHGIQFYFSGDVARAQVRHARAALAALDELARDDEPTSRLRARLHAVLAAGLVGADVHAARRHAAESVRLARPLGEPATLAVALIAEQITDLGPGTLHRRLHTAREIIALAESAAAHDLAVNGHFLLMGALLERGEISELDAELVHQGELIDQFAAPRFARHALWFRCTRAMFDGDPERVERLAHQCFAIAERLGDPDGLGVFGAQYGVALWMRGRVLAMEDAYLDSMRAEPTEPVWPAVLAWLWSTHERRDEARGALDRLPPVAEIPSGQHTLLTLVTAAEAAIVLDDRPLATELWEALLPYADHVVPIAMGAACWGTVAQHLGHLARHLGHDREALGHFERAIAACARLRARPWLVDAQLALADTLLDTDPTDPRIGELGEQARRSIDDLGLEVFARRLTALTERRAASRGTGTGTEPSGAPTKVGVGMASRPTTDGRPRIAVLGTFEVNATDGTVPRWTSRKARQLLKILVARRGAPIPREALMEMLWPEEDLESLSNRLAVAISTVRRALDPLRAEPADRFIAAESGALKLVVRNVDLDTEQFLAAARRAIDASRSGSPDARSLVRAARAGYGGDALADEPYADWARSLRAETTDIYAALLRIDAADCEAEGDHVAAADAHRRLLELDAYDEPAHVGLIRSLRCLGAHGQADAALARYRAAMAELGVPADPTAG
jgi:DNA-binding SARP family transcriptional activator